MPINPLSTVLHLASNSFGDAPAATQPIDILVKPGDTLTPPDFLQRVVMNALDTMDSKKADDFLQQSGLKLDKLPEPLNNAAGERVYRFTPDEKFQKSIESYRQTGKALPLQIQAETTTGKEPIKPNGTAVRPSAKPEQVIAERHKQNSKANEPFTAELRATRFLPAPPRTESFELARQGRGAAFVKVTLTPAEIAQLATVKDGDPRLEIVTLALSKMRYSKEAVAAALKDGAGVAMTDGTIDIWDGSPKTPMTKEAAVKWLTKVQAGQREPTFSLSADTRQKAFAADLRLQGGAEAAKQFELQLKIDEETRRIDFEFDKMLPADNGAQRALQAAAREQAKKDAIDRLTNGSNADLRTNNTTGEKVGNTVADAMESAMRFFVKSHPLYSLMPEGAQNEIVKFGVGIGRGTIQLAGAARGAQSFFQDAAMDALVYGTEQSGLDKQLGLDLAPFKQQLSESRKQETDLWRNVMNARTAEMARGDFAYSAKKDQNLNLSIFEIPNWSVKAGELTAKAVPFIIVGVATGGTSVGVQVVVSAGAAGLQGLGETYAASGSRPEAIKAAAWSAAQGAVGPLTSKLNIVADVAINAAVGYTVAKVQNPNADDNELLQSIMLQTAHSGGFRVGSKMHETLSTTAGRQLTEAETRQQFEQTVKENLPVIKEEVATSAKAQVETILKDTEVGTVAAYLEEQARTRNNARPGNRPDNPKIGDLQIGGANARARVAEQTREILANWGKNNRFFTKESYRQAKAELAKQQLYTGFPIDKLPVFSKIAGHHLEAGTRGIKDFARVMRAEAENAGMSWQAMRPRVEGLYREAMQKLGLEVDEKAVKSVRKTFETEALEEAKPLSRKADIDAFRTQSKIEAYSYGDKTGTVAFTEVNGQKTFGTNTTLGRDQLGSDHRALRDAALSELHQLGELKGVKYGAKETMFLTHAEADSLIRTAAAFKGKMPKEMEMYVDRPTCGDCQEGLPLLVKLYGIEKLTIRDSHGHLYEVTQKGTTKIQ